jgi:phosphoribosylformylglycinamidine (FGAM) synthase-like amidotransferase family enzyme
MPHPERAFRMLQNAWKKPENGDGYWLQMFKNAKKFAG